MDNYVIFSAARTGSTYLTAAVAKQIGVLEPNIFYGGELFRWNSYFQLSRPEVAGPGSLEGMKLQPDTIDEYDRTQPTGEGTHFFIGEGGKMMRESRETSWNEVAPVSFRRAWEESQRRLTMLDNSYFPWVIKVHPEHLDCMDKRRFDRLINNEKTKVVILYRSSLWDWFLSFVAVRRTGIFQQSQTQEDWDKPEVVEQEVSLETIRDWYGVACEFLNMAMSYRDTADHIIPYESFSGDPRRDACSITGIDLFPPNVGHTVKLWSREEKEQMIANLDEVKSTFRSYCKLLGYSGGRMFI